MRFTTGYTLYWHDNHLTFEMRRGRVVKRPWIKRWGWVKNPGFQIRLDWQCCEMSLEIQSLDSYLLRSRDFFFLYGTSLPLWDFMSLCGPCNRYLRLGVVRIKTLRPYVGSWCPSIWYWCPSSLCWICIIMFISPTIKKLLKNRAESFVMLESRLCTLMSGLGTFIFVLVPLFRVLVPLCRVFCFSGNGSWTVGS